jgi:AcrR family transcriptional regulator
MGEVAARLGLDRSSLHYYFRTREELIVAATRRIAAFYVKRLEDAAARLSADDRARKLVDYLFGPKAHQPRLSCLIDELSARGNREAFFQEQVVGIYRELERIVVNVIDLSFPNRPVQKRHAVAYSILQLSEGTSVFTSLGFDQSRRLAARQAALALLEGLALDTR